MIPARQYSTGSEILAGAVAVRKRLFSPRKRPVKPVPERLWPNQHDQHVKDWRDRMKIEHEQPAHFIQRRCAELGFDYDAIVGPSRKHYLIETRHRLMFEVWEQFEHLSFPRIGRLFGGRDHTVVIFAIKKMKGEHRARHRHTVYRETIIALYNAGFMQKDIAARANCAPSAVSRVLAEVFPDRPRRKCLSDVADEVKRLFDGGETYAEIALQLDFNPSAVSKFIKKRGWMR